MSRATPFDERIETRLYLTVPANLLEQDAAAARELERLCQRLDVACVAIELPLADEGTLASLVHKLQEHGVAVVAGIDQIALMATPGGDDPAALVAQLAIARRLGCDGVHLPGDDRLFTPARRTLPADAIIGAACAASRHQAMLFGELGVDYVAFAGDADQVVDLVGWWQDLFEIPCVAWQVGDPQALDALLALPADFIALAPQQWREPQLVERLAAACTRRPEPS